MCYFNVITINVVKKLFTKNPIKQSSFIQLRCNHQKRKGTRYTPQNVKRSDEIRHKDLFICSIKLTNVLLLLKFVWLK